MQRSRPTTQWWLATAAVLVAAGIAVHASGPPQAPGLREAVQRATVTGELIVSPPTLLSLGFDWWIEGDDNRTARVDVAYRRTGQSDWRTAQPLLRLQNEIIGEGAGAWDADYGNPQPFDGLKYQTANMFSGSVLNLEPDTEYEVRLTLSDPDGVKGQAVRTTTVRTRGVPREVAGGKTYHVYPPGHQGARQEPSFIGLHAAYYMGCGNSDLANAYPPRVQPGDVILVHAGLYQSDRSRYLAAGSDAGNAELCTPFDGTYYLTQSGTAAKPIVIKAAGDGEVIFDGDGAHNLFNVMAANYNYFDGITVRNTNVAFLAGTKDIAGSSGFVLKNSKVYNVGRAVHNDWSGSKNYYIADNIFTGRLIGRDKLVGPNGGKWDNLPGGPEVLGGNGGSEYAVKVYGQGHVVAYNKMYGWHDGVDVATYGSPDGYCRLCLTPKEIYDRTPLAIDFYNNDIDNMGDNCIESDGSARNVRIFRNRCLNIAAGALSTQPVLGGPIYFIENIVYTQGNVLKFVRTSSGIVVYHNTFVGDRITTSPVSNVHFMNNLILGTDLPNPVFGPTTFTNYSTSDHNGIRLNRNDKGGLVWNSPPYEMVRDYERMPKQRYFQTLKEYTASSGKDKRSVEVDYNVFRNVTMPDTKDITKLYKPEDLDFRLAPGAVAIDAGIPIPNVNDGFSGKAPDLGVVEADRQLPHYGPRAATGATSTASRQR